MLDLSLTKPTTFNDTQFTEKLSKEESIIIGRDTVRRIRRAPGIKPIKGEYRMLPFISF